MAEEQAVQESAPEVTGEHFGDTSHLEKEDTDWLEDDPVTTEAAPEQQEEVEAEVEAAPSQPERLYLGKYKTPEDLEHGFKNVQRLEAKARERADALEQRSQELEAALRQVAQHLMAQEATSQDGLQPGQVDPRMLNGLVEQKLNHQQAAQQAEQLRSQVNSEIASFREAFPEVQDGTAIDDDMSKIVYEFQEDDQGALNHDLFPVTRQNLEIAYVLAKNPALYDAVIELDLKPTEDNLHLANECVSNPRLRKIFEAEPHLLETDAGVELARERAQLPNIVASAQTRARPNPEAARRAAYVETGGTGAPVQGAPGNRPKDPMDEAIAAYHGRSRSVFG